MKNDTFERLRELAGEEPEEKAKGQKKEKQAVGSIIEKIQEKDRTEEISEARTARIKQALTGQKQAEVLSFGRVRLSESNGTIKAIGGVYAAFQSPLSKASELFSRLPLAAELESNLRASGMKLDVESYLAITSTAAFIAAVMVAIIFSTLGLSSVQTGIEAAQSVSVGLIMGILTFVLSGILLLMYPNLKATDRAAEIDRELPFALRQMATQMKAGVSFQKAMNSVANANYGPLSQEFRKTLADMGSGKPTEKALIELTERTKSKGLKQAMMQIVRSLKTGGSMSEIISNIASDVAFETRMKIRDFTEQLNLISIVFTMVAIVAPVVITILAAIMQLPLLGGNLNEGIVIVAFGAIIMLTIVILAFIKRIEPVT